MDQETKSIYQKYVQERNEALKQVDDDLKEHKLNRQVVEQWIRLQVLKNMNKRKKEFFSWEDLTEVKWVKEFFDVYIATGDRNMGKSYSAYQVIEKEVLKGNAVVMLRTQDNEREQLYNLEAQNFEKKGVFKDYTKHFKRSNLYLTKDNEEFDEDLPITSQPIALYYRALSTVYKFKSIDFPRASMIFYDEFNTEAAMKNKVNHFIHFITTVQRERKNFKVYLAANYLDQGDPFLEFLGVGSDVIGDCLKFNWITKTIFWFIPKGIYSKIATDKSQVGYRMSLANQETYSKQYGGEFVKVNDTNVRNVEDVIIKVPLFKLKCGFLGDSYDLYFSTAIDKKTNDEIYYVTSNKTSDIPYHEVTISIKDKIKWVNTTLIDSQSLSIFIENFMNDEIKVGEASSLKVVQSIIYDILNKNESNDFIQPIDRLK